MGMREGENNEGYGEWVRIMRGMVTWVNEDNEGYLGCCVTRQDTTVDNINTYDKTFIVDVLNIIITLSYLFNI